MNGLVPFLPTRSSHAPKPFEPCVPLRARFLGGGSCCEVGITPTLINDLTVLQVLHVSTAFAGTYYFCCCRSRRNAATFVTTAIAGIAATCRDCHRPLPPWPVFLLSYAQFYSYKYYSSILRRRYVLLLRGYKKHEDGRGKAKDEQGHAGCTKIRTHGKGRRLT